MTIRPSRAAIAARGLALYYPKDWEEWRMSEIIDITRRIPKDPGLNVLPAFGWQTHRRHVDVMHERDS